MIRGMMWQFLSSPMRSRDTPRLRRHSTVSEIRSLKMPGETLSLPTVICYHSFTSGKSDFVEISPHLTGLTACSCHSGCASSEPILFGDWTSKTLQSSIAVAWKTILTTEPDRIVIHPVIPADWSNKTARAFWHFCAEVCRWQDDRGCYGFWSSQCSRSLKWRSSMSFVTFENHGELGEQSRGELFSFESA